MFISCISVVSYSQKLEFMAALGLVPPAVLEGESLAD